MSNLIIQNLNKKYHSKNILKNINISFELGKIHGIIGDNGAGKSTLFECLCGLRKYEGKIKVADFKNPLTKNIAYLPTVPFFYSKITGAEYLTFIQKITNTKKVKNITELANLFKLPLNKYIENYSTGMKKKLSFLGVLQLNKPIYLLDEPFNGADLEGVLVFKSIINKLNERGATIFISSHIINSLTDICNDIYHLKNGNFFKKYDKQDFGKINLDIYNSFNEKISDTLKKI